MFVVLWTGFLFATVCDCSVVKEYKLDIVHYNDFHSRFEETSLANSICRTNDNLCLGGFPRLYHKIQELMRQKPNAILLNAGDNFQGTYWFTALRGSITDQFLNMLPHDAYAIGNHEFDDGPAKLGEFLGKLNAPVLVANMDTSKEPALQGKYRPSTVVERKGRKIGIIGLITEDLATFLDIGKVKFTDAGEATRREALALKEKGVDIIIVLSHCGLEVDRFEETSLLTPTCSFNNNSCLGGFPRLYHEIEVLLNEKPDAVLLNAGDSFQGTYWYTLLKWNVTQEFMNLLPHDAHALGNHEFDDGPAGLAPYLKALKAPVVAANMDATKEPLIEGMFRPHVIVKRKGRKIGIIGLITPETKDLASPGNVVFTDPGEATKREARELTEQGVDIIILLSHCGLDVDKQLARDYGEYIDIIIGGHTHSLLWNGDTPSGEKAEGPYPVFVETAGCKDHKVLIVQASAFTKYMGNLSVYFDYKGDFVSWEGNAIYLDRSIEEDGDIKRKLEPYAKLVHDAENEAIGESENTLNFEDCVFGECALGNLIVAGMVDYAQNYVNSEREFLAFVQRGNIKSTILSGNISKREVFEVLPYNGLVEMFELQGQHVIEALERSVSSAWAFDPFKGPFVLQVAGLQVTYNVSQPEGSRITSLYLGDVNSTTPLEPNRYYSVVASKFLADGGDGYTMFKDNRRNITIIGRDTDILTSYIQKQSPLNVTTDGRITIQY